MSKLIFREDGYGLAFNCELDDNLDTYEILRESYPYLLNSIEEEEFILENPKSNLFKELVYDNLVVGFCSYDLDNGTCDFALNAIYVLPEYRGNNLLFNEITSILAVTPSFSIFEPNNLIIDLLIKYGFAEKLNEYLVSSAITLDVPIENYMFNDDSYPLYDDMLCGSNLYDTSISATLFLMDISSPNTNVIGYSRLLDSDAKFYNAKEHRENLDESHFEDIKEDIEINSDEFRDTIIRLKDNLPKAEIDVYELIGEPPELSDTLKELINNGYLSLERAKLIQKQILMEYENGNVLNESLVTRLHYLCIEDQVDDEDIDYVAFGMKCPYCHNPINLSDRSCTLCGYALRHDTFINEKEDPADNLIGMIEEIISTEEIDDFQDLFYKINEYPENKDAIKI